MDFATGGASAYLQGPISPDSWKRAVYRSAPQYFYVGVLTPEKHGGSYSYGLRISPIKDDNASISAHSTSSKGSHLEYEIWRKWEDCLWFQDTLEAEYTLMAREKRTRLAAGKGVKKDGMYIQSDQAASFDSLPPGPDPHSVARDIHEYIPKLTKKGTLFRASQATIDQRFTEFRTMINAFFQEGLPTLLKELMATRTFTDFFGYWRRDHDLAIKTQRAQTSPAKPRRSVSSSMLSAYFHPPSPALSDAMPSSTSVNGSHKQLPRRGSGTSDSLSSDNSLKDQRTARPRVNGHPASLTISLQSRDSKSTLSSSSSSSNSPSPITPRRSSTRTPVVVTHESPIKFGHNPQHTPAGGASERRTLMLQVLPEDQEVEINKVVSADYSPTRRRETNRSARVFGPPSQSSSDLSDDGEVSSDAASRARCSWLSTASVSPTRAAAYLEELGVEFTLPHPHPEHAHRPRASMCSMVSYRSDASADAIIPRSARAQSPPSAGTRQYRHSVPFPDEEEWAEREPWADESAYGEDDLLDAYFYDAIPPSSVGSSPTPTEDSHFSSHQRGSYPTSAYAPRRSSMTTSVSSGSTGCSDGSAIAIKALHDNNIIMLRVPRSLSFTEVRQRLYDKFVRQEGVPLSESFAVAILVPAPAKGTPGGRPYAASFSSMSAAGKDDVVLHFVKSNDDWDQAIYKYGNKVLLRVIGSRT
ncbi:hypothetical protein DEU56DRAFT_917660 [Suillus clintonianus]|uniref:uncharacterized protein n=1 Tax=Suillus clintonianus TaxID=1904413 RepID=UPI001B870FAC|nr:uncharacterized protein DEU56DRAFT_917660 [Suillus clintonianus]KAG2122766.1 hypothetical protein DEU56DRAFT_917660 [Suillus clintonianus]